MADRPDYARLRVLFFGDRDEPVEIHTLQGGEARVELVGSDARGEERSGDSVLGVEARDTVRLRALVEQRLSQLSTRPGRRFYFVLPDRAGAATVERMLRKRSIGPFELYGVDPDYYYGLVPIAGRGHRRIESFVLGLKPEPTRAGKIRRLVKRSLIWLNASARLYEAFVVVGGDERCW